MPTSGLINQTCGVDYTGQYGNQGACNVMVICTDPLKVTTTQPRTQAKHFLTGVKERMAELCDLVGRKQKSPVVLRMTKLDPYVLERGFRPTQHGIWFAL